MITGKKSSTSLLLRLLFLVFGFFYLLSSAQAASPTSQNSVRMYYFYSRDCRECIDIKDNLLPALNQKYEHLLEIKYFEISDPDNYNLLLELEKRFHSLKNPPPSIFINDQVLDGEAEIRANLENLIKHNISIGGCDWPVPEKQRTGQATELAIGEFKNLAIPIVIGAGLLDGINPCAFATIIFLISYLAFIGRKGKDLLLIGWAFTLSVFITYLLIGMGLFEIIKRMAIFPLLSRMVSLAIAGAAALLGILSVYDYYEIKKGKMKDIVLQLPQSIKDKIHLVIRKESRMKHFILASLFLGFLVALLEFPCTGQVYLPIIFVLRHTQDLRLYAFSYLILYNLMFILPLIAVFIFAYKGISSQRLTKLMQENAAKVKIFTAILFFMMAVILVL